MAAGVLGLAVCALIADQMIGLPAEPAMAAAAPDGAPAPTSPAASNQERAPQHQGMLAARLDQLGGSARVQLYNDAFLTPAAWFPPPTKEEEIAIQAESTAKHRVTALVGQGDRAVAVINNYTIALGKTVAGITLLEVRRIGRTGGVAVIEVDGKRIELPLLRTRDASNAITE
jgi:hypothetical protein